jgi:hypothetical protein
MKYEGTILGFNYEIELENDQAFEDWLEAKLLRYKFKPLELKILKIILGITELELKISELEKR